MKFKMTYEEHPLISDEDKIYYEEDLLGIDIPNTEKHPLQKAVTKGKEIEGLVEIMREKQATIRRQAEGYYDNKPKEDDKLFSASWIDVTKDGKRMDRLIRMMEKRLKKIQDIEQIVKLCNAIGFITGKKREIQNAIIK